MLLWGTTSAHNVFITEVEKPSVSGKEQYGSSLYASIKQHKFVRGNKNLTHGDTPSVSTSL